MYKAHYEFGNLVIFIESELPVTDYEYTSFFRCEERNYTYKVNVLLTNKKIMDFSGFGFFNRNGNIFNLYLNSEKYIDISIIKIFSFIPMDDMLLENNMFLFHSAFIEYKNSGVLFSGNSGVGKTTQALLWNEHNGARIINGDRALIYKEDDIFYASGCYQCGTSGISLNEKHPIKAIVFLEHGSDNNIALLGGLLAFKQIIGQSSYNSDNGNHVRTITQIAAEIVEKVPVYHYSCRKDSSSVERLEELLYG